MALLPPFFLDTVVAIGAGDDSATRKWIGTGFIIGKAVDVAIEIAKRQYAIYIVTNKHVVKDQAKLYAKFNSANDPLSKDYAIDLKKPDGTPIWVGHPNPNVDVAVIRIDPNILKNEGRLFQFFQLENHSSTKQELKSCGTTEGDRVFVLGFPMGLV
jgi:S1-C subfamily serine protease